jgi:hypothetical protein
MVHIFANAPEKADGAYIRRFDDRPRARHDQQMPPALLVLLADHEVLRRTVASLSPTSCQLPLLFEHVPHHVQLADGVFRVGEGPLGEDLLGAQDGLVLHAAQDMPAQERRRPASAGLLLGEAIALSY